MGSKGPYEPLVPHDAARHSEWIAEGALAALEEWNAAGHAFSVGEAARLSALLAGDKW